MERHLSDSFVTHFCQRQLELPTTLSGKTTLGIHAIKYAENGVGQTAVFPQSYVRPFFPNRISLCSKPEYEWSRILAIRAVDIRLPMQRRWENSSSHCRDAS